MAGDSESWEVGGPKWCGKPEARTRSGSVRPLKTTLSGVAVLGLLCLIASIGDARRWPVGGPTEVWQTHQLRARWLLQAGTSTSSSSQASTTPILYGQVLKQTDRSSGSLAVDGGAVVVARVIQPPPPPPPRSLVPTTIRGTLSPQAVFVGIAFGTFVACCIGVFLAWRTIETTDWSQVRAWLSKWLGRPLAQQQATMVSTLNGERTDGPQAEAGATEAATADATTHSPTTGGYVSGTGSQSQLAQAGASSAGDGNTPAGPATLAPLPLAGVHVAGSHPGRETEDSHARSQLAAGPHSQRPLAQNEGVSNGGAPAEDAAGLGGHPAGCGSDGLRLAAARLPGQLATNSDASLGAGETAGVQGLTPAGASVGCSPGGNA